MFYPTGPVDWRASYAVMESRGELLVFLSIFFVKFALNHDMFIRASLTQSFLWATSDINATTYWALKAGYGTRLTNPEMCFLFFYETIKLDLNPHF